MWRYKFSSTTPLLGLGAVAFVLYSSPLDTTHLTLTHAILFAVTLILISLLQKASDALNLLRAAQHDVHALLSELLRHGPADRARAARDERDLAL